MKPSRKHATKGDIARSAAAVLITAAILAGAAFAEDPAQSPLAEQTAAARADARKALDELNGMRERIAAERAALENAKAELERETGALRAKATAVDAAAAAGESRRAGLERGIGKAREELSFISAALSDYRRSMETRAEPAESFWLKAALDEVDDPPGAWGGAGNAPIVAGLLFEAARRRNSARIYGSEFDAACLDSNGLELRGSFVYFGPCGYFSAKDRLLAGPVVTRPGSAMPGVYESVPERDMRAIQGLFAGRAVEAPVDVTGGGALRVETGRESLVEHLKSGGAVMVPLLAVGLAAVFLILRKALQFMKLRPEAPGAIEKIAALARAGDIDNAKAEALAIGAPLGEILAEGLDLRDSPREHVEEIMHERLLASAPAIERGLGALAVCAGVAPLLGLLGTVTGMIHTFQLVRVFGTGEARLLASGISEALVTTEAGLAIAIPVLIVHAYFARKTRATISAMEQGIIAFADRLKRDIHD